MKNLRFGTKLISIAATALTLVSPFCNKEQPSKPNYTINSDYQITNPVQPFAFSSSGHVYIAPETEIEQLMTNIHTNAVFIIDERINNDPNVQIQDSSQITNQSAMLEILQILDVYEKIYPSNWDRTISSMMLEWQVHNLCSCFNYKNSHTDDVDLNNEDEELYTNKLLQKLLDK